MITPPNSHNFQNLEEVKRLGLKLSPPWTALLGLIIFTILGILGAANLLRIGFPVASFAIGLFLYRKYPLYYNSFVWWLFFLTPLVRRLVDFRSGYQDQALILSAPFLVTAITIPRLIQYALGSDSYRQLGLPYILAFVAIFYSFLIGLVNLGFNFQIMRTLAEWIAPVAFGFFVISNWRSYPKYKENTQKTFLWGAIVMGIYGLIQFVAMPPWDSYWQEKVVEISGYVNAQSTENGSAIWSTANTSGHLALQLIPCIILLLFNNTSSLSIPAAVISSLAFLLTNSRTSWILAFVVLFITMGSLRSSLQIRIILIALVVGLCVLPLTSIQPFSGMISSRVETLSNVQDDHSAVGRIWQFQSFFNSDGLFDPIGSGMSSVNHPDSGIINLISEMGWLGSFPFLSGLILLLWQLFQNSGGNYDSFNYASRAIALALATSPSGNFFLGLPGFIIWFFASISLAGFIYDKHQLTNQNLKS